MSLSLQTKMRLRRTSSLIRMTKQQGIKCCMEVRHLITLPQMSKQVSIKLVTKTRLLNTNQLLKRINQRVLLSQVPSQNKQAQQTLTQALRKICPPMTRKKLNNTQNKKTRKQTPTRSKATLNKKLNKRNQNKRSQNKNRNSLPKQRELPRLINPTSKRHNQPQCQSLQPKSSLPHDCHIIVYEICY